MLNAKTIAAGTMIGIASLMPANAGSQGEEHYETAKNAKTEKYVEVNGAATNYKIKTQLPLKDIKIREKRKPSTLGTAAFSLNIPASYFISRDIFYRKYKEGAYGEKKPFHFMSEPLNYANGLDAYGGNLILAHSGSTFFSMAYEALGYNRLTADLLGALNTSIIYGQAKYIEGRYQGVDARDLKGIGIGLGLFLAQAIERNARKDNNGLLNRINLQFYKSPFPQEEGTWSYARQGNFLDNYARQKYFWQVRIGDLFIKENNTALERIISGLSIGPGYGLSKDGHIDKYLSFGLDLEKSLEGTRVPKQVRTALNYLHIPNVALKFGEKGTKMVFTW